MPGNFASCFDQTRGADCSPTMLSMAASAFATSDYRKFRFSSLRFGRSQCEALMNSNLPRTTHIPQFRLLVVISKGCGRQCGKTKRKHRNYNNNCRTRLMLVVAANVCNNASAPQTRLPRWLCGRVEPKK